MSNEIKAGDLVRVAYMLPCCGRRPSTYGLIFYVAEIGVYDACCSCGAVFRQSVHARRMGTRRGVGGMLLKKIDTPMLNDEVEHNEAVVG